MCEIVALFRLGMTWVLVLPERGVWFTTDLRVQKAAKGVCGGGCTDGDDGVLVDAGHLGALEFPVFFRVLDDAEGVDSNVPDA